MIRDVNGLQITSAHVHRIQRITDPRFRSARRGQHPCQADRKEPLNFYTLKSGEEACCFCGCSRVKHRSPKKEAK